MKLVETDDAARAFGLGEHELICLVGGGGKTTLLFAIGRALGGRIVLTTTTKMSATRTEGYDVLRGPTDHDIAAITRTTLTWAREEGPKAIGVGPEAVDRWFDLVDHVIVEADGARRKPFKAPAHYEPVIPTRTTTVIAVIGADALDRVIEDQCHRPLRVAAAARCSSYDRLTPERAARVLISANGSRRNVPVTARFVVAITKIDADNQSFAERVASEIAGAVDAVVGVRVHRDLETQPDQRNSGARVPGSVPRP